MADKSEINRRPPAGLWLACLVCMLLAQMWDGNSRAENVSALYLHSEWSAEDHEDPETYYSQELLDDDEGESFWLL
jgi:hypothetical protein